MSTFSAELINGSKIGYALLICHLDALQPNISRELFCPVMFSDPFMFGGIERLIIVAPYCRKRWPRVTLTHSLDSIYSESG